MRAICLIALNPSKIWCEFLNSFNDYKIFVVVDDNNFNLSTFTETYKNITFVKINNTTCESSGIKNLTGLTLNKTVTAWDKAIYYFINENQKYEHVWFMEDDVFFTSEYTLKELDRQYPNSDLLSKSLNENKNGEKTEWLWRLISDMYYPPPYYCTMVCAVRFSTRMLNSINEYAKKYNTLFFLEASFPTIAMKNKLLVNHPVEFDTIHWRYDFQKQNINSNNLYHPIKDLNLHVSFRN